MKIIKAEKKHVNDLFAWRNDLHTRKMSMSSELISFESHLIWFRSILDDKNQFLYIGLNEVDKIGFCRFNLNQKEMIAEVSINLNPSMRGKKYSFQLLSLTMEQYFKEQKTDLIANIKKENLASIRLFVKSGFLLQTSENNYFVYKFTGKDNESYK